MLAGRLQWSFLLALLVPSGCASPARGPEPAGATSASVGSKPPQVADVRAAVFEVVVPKFENPDIQYAEPLPVHLLPHHERTDAYFSIGTAFTLDGASFISAAHVFWLQGETQFAERRLRGEDGAIYEIDKFVGHSGVRDLVVFTLRNPPAVARPLARGTKPEVGSQVYTVGNALGEGLSVRGGNVASFTPEPLESSWNFIRYSAPTSPGNSGGPLLDDHGGVVGIVVRRSSEENLNYAIPIEELDSLSSTRADFYSRISERESGHELYMDWRFDTELPADYGTLANRAKAGYRDGIVQNRLAFELKFSDRLFPTAAELRTFLREQAVYYYPTEVVREPSGRWALGAPHSQSSHEVSGEQVLYIGKSGDYFYVVLERPAEVPLATFFAEPARVIEAALRTLNVERTYAGAQIRVTSYGPPHHQSAWRDELGRPWTSTTWRLYGDKSSILHCTPYPRGLACFLDETTTSAEPLAPVYAAINARRWALSYDGKVSDWIEFMALDPALRPTFLSGSVTLAGSRLSATLGPIGVAASNPAYSPDSLLFADVQYVSMSPPALEVTGVAINTSKSRGLSLKVDRIAEPLSTSTQGQRDFWDKLVARSAPYDAKIVRDGETAEMMVVDVTSPMVLPPDSNVEARTLTSCWTGDNVAVPDAALAKACTAFRKSIAIAPD